MEVDDRDIESCIEMLARHQSIPPSWVTYALSEDARNRQMEAMVGVVTKIDTATRASGRIIHNSSSGLVVEDAFIAGGKEQMTYRPRPKPRHPLDPPALEIDRAILRSGSSSPYREGRVVAITATQRLWLRIVLAIARWFGLPVRWVDAVEDSITGLPRNHPLEVGMRMVGPPEKMPGPGTKVSE